MPFDNLHIPPARLEQLLARELPEADEATLTGHIEACPACRENLERAAGDADWWRDARRYLSSAEGAAAPGDERAAARSAAGSPPAPGDEAPAEISLDFLGPTDDPAMLGRVGPYEVAGVVGRGGTGIVLKAFERALHRFVAVKVLAPHLAASAAARKRFAREAQAAAAVVHEHIVPIYAVDEHRGLPYMVMRYVPGRSLQERLDRQGTLGLREILRIGRQTAAGLAAAHAQGLVHRDIKPANILLEHGVERVLLTDFGLARTVDEASLTCSGMVAGTPQYMAPEQARGETVDHRTDLFSLGSVLYAMAAGHSPFRAETTMGVLHRICTDRPRPLRQQNPEIPDWLERIIRKLHAKHPARRFQSADEVAQVLADRLARLQRGETVCEPWWDRARAAAADVWGVERWKRAALCAAAALILFLFALRWTGVWPVGDAVQTAAVVDADRARAAQAARAERAAAEASDLGWQPRAQDFEGLRESVERAERSLFAPSAPSPDTWAPAVADLRQRLDRLERELPEATGSDDLK